MRTVLGISFFLLIATGLVAQDTVLMNLIKKGLADNPEIKAMEKMIEAQKQIPPQAGTLPDPMLSLGFMNLPTNSWRFDRETMTAKEIGISQEFPASGKLPLRKKAAEKDVDISTYQLREVKNEVARDIKLAYFQLYLIDKSVRIVNRSISQLKDLVSLAEIKYGNNLGNQQDVFRAQVELAKFYDKLIELNTDKEMAYAMLNEMLNLHHGEVLPPPALILKFPRVTDFSSLLAIAKQNRPLFFALAKAKEKEEIQLQLAYKEYKPDYNAMLAYSQRDKVDDVAMSGDDMVSVSVSFNLPVRTATKQDKMVLERKYMIEYWDQKLNTEYNKTFHKIHEALANMKSDSQKIELYTTTVIPQTRSSLESARIGYTANKNDFSALVEQQLMLYEYELEIEEMKTDYVKQSALLEYYIGKDLSAVGGKHHEKIH